MTDKRQTVRLLLAALLFSSAMLACLSPIRAQGPTDAPDIKTVIDAEGVMEHVRALAEDIGPRLLGTDAEARAADYIAAQFRAYSYDVSIQTFGTIAPEDCDLPNPLPLTSRNVIATRVGQTQPEEIVVVGAHMDSVGIGQGAGDNASGVAAMLAAAEALAEIAPSRTLVFVAFGANEGGCSTGSDAYIQALGDDIDHVVAMISVDGVGLGDPLNAYAGAIVAWGAEDQSAPLSVEGGPVWLRNLAVEQASALGYTLGTTPPESWDGFIGDWGDHIGFVEHQIPVVVLEAWRWQGEAVTDPWWGAETSAGDLSHTDQDRVEAIHSETVEAAAEIVAFTANMLATDLAAIPAG